MRCLRLLSVFLCVSASLASAQQQPATSGTFVLHKFAQPIGKETYGIAGERRYLYFELTFFVYGPVDPGAAGDDVHGDDAGYAAGELFGQRKVFAAVSDG